MDNRFIIIVGSYNNAQWVENNISSILSQDYQNYQVVYFADASTDGTADLVNQKTFTDTRFKIITSKDRVYKTWFFYHLHEFVEIEDNDILVFLDGDDMFSAENVLSYLNDVYNKSKCWMTYGGMTVWEGDDVVKEPYPQNSEIPLPISNAKAYRQDTWRTSHLKTMRGFVWNKFNKEDLKQNDTFMVGPDDLAIMFAALEICPPGKVYRVTDPLYLYNHSHANNQSRAYTEHKATKVDYEKIVRSRKPYDTLPIVMPTLAGGVGNQMFEVAAAASLAKDNGAQLIVNPNEHILPNQGRNVNTYADNIFSNIIFDANCNHLLKNSYSWDKCTYKPIPYAPNIKLGGHYQSYKYFHHNKDYIKNLFDAPKSVARPMLVKYRNEIFEDFNNKVRAGIQVRRGDYIKFPNHHPMMTAEYYKKAIDIIKPDVIWVFSDDLQWCKDNFDFQCPVYYIKDEDYVEMYMLRLCHNIVISNSSFGWWAAYLNRNQTPANVYVPSNWFGRALIDEGFNIDDLVLPEWNKL